MISDHAFTEGIDLLCTHYGRQLDPRVVKIWQTYLNTFLDDDLFEQAINYVVVYSKNFPTASEIVDQVRYEIADRGKKRDEIASLEKTFSESSEEI